ncbi:MAG: hypothetical protein Q7R84_02500 [bacterium]|nr:hypothetical protein [bacterium]
MLISIFTRDGRKTEVSFSDDKEDDAARFLAGGLLVDVEKWRNGKWKDRDIISTKEPQAKTIRHILIRFSEIAQIEVLDSGG